MCVVHEVGYYDTRWLSPIDGVEGIEKLLIVVRISFDGIEYFVTTSTLMVNTLSI